MLCEERVIISYVCYQKEEVREPSGLLSLAFLLSLQNETLESLPFQNNSVLLNAIGLGSEPMNSAVSASVPLKHN